MRLIIKGIKLSKKEVKTLDSARDIIDRYASELEYCGMDDDVIATVINANEIIDSIASGEFYDEYIEEE